MTDPIDPIRAALAGRYEIERKIGEGAFATVYLARDLRHDRLVAQWSHSGRELFYRDASGNLVAVEVKTTPTFSAGRSATLFPAAGFASFPFRPQYDVSLDDQRFLMIRPLPASGPDQLIVVENWFEELKAKLRK